MRIALSSSHLPTPKFRYSPVVEGGGIVQFAGLVALDPATGTLVPGGAGAETAQILSMVVASLPDLGLTLDDLLIARIFTTRFEDFAAINTAWEAVFDGAAPPPARTAMGVAALPVGAAVEIEFTFVRPSSKGKPA